MTRSQATTRVRVALDVTPEINGNTGIARYAQQLRTGLARRADVRVRPYAIGRGGTPDGVRRLPVPLRAVHQAWRWHVPLSVRPLTGTVDVVHCTDLVPPPTRRPILLTIHDLLALEHPELFPERTIRTVRDAVAQLDRVACVITTCETTADTIARITAFPRARIRAIPLGRRETSGPAPATRRLPWPYLLAVGVVQRRKAADVLIRAVASLGPAAPHVVLAGPLGQDSDIVLRAIDETGSADRVHVLDRVGDEELEGLYRNAMALCHLSTAEGFGIPVLEALGFGTPVIAADIPPVREMAAGCAQLVPPRDVPATAEAIGRLTEDREAIAALVEAGHARAAGYTWDRTVTETAAAYRDFADDKG